MGSNTDTVETFYRAFQRRDNVAMSDCYHPSIHFSDPVFTDLHGGEAATMWHMLCERGSDLEVTFRDVIVDGENRMRAHWEARYTFGPKRRLVHNIIDASLLFEEGRIIRHVDDFDLWRWTRMALGTTGILTGWSSPTRTKVRATARRGLARFIDTHPEYK